MNFQVQRVVVFRISQQKNSVSNHRLCQTMILFVIRWKHALK